jgi:transketolase
MRALLKPNSKIMTNDPAESKIDLLAVERIARAIRRLAIELTIEKSGCYLSQALSSAEMLACLYGGMAKIGPSTEPAAPTRFAGVPRPGFHETGAGYNGPVEGTYDRILLSASHYAVAIYSALVAVGRLSESSLSEFNTDGSRVEMIGAEHSPGMELTAGSFGQALSQASGIALARKLRSEPGRLWVFMSDGEFEEGQTYEALQCLAFHRLDNITVLVDANGQQVDGATKDVMNIEPLAERIRAFGCHCEEVDGHSIASILKAGTRRIPERPTIILCRTDTARGLPFLAARKPFLHYVRFKNNEEIAEAKAIAESLKPR